MKVSQISSLNRKIRAGNLGYSEKMFLNRAEVLGLTTKSGYISKSKKAQTSKQLERLFCDYKDMREQEDIYQDDFIMIIDFEGLLQEYIVPSEKWQIIRNSKTAFDFIDNILNKISIYDTFEEDYREEFEKYLFEKYQEL